MEILAAFGLSASAGLKRIYSTAGCFFIIEVHRFDRPFGTLGCPGELVDYRAADRTLPDRILCGQGAGSQPYQ